MANNKQKKSSFSLFNMFKGRRPRRSSSSEDTWDDSRRKIWPSDEDRGSWVADPRIDEKVTDFIAKFHANQVLASERIQLQAHAVNCRAAEA